MNLRKLVPCLVALLVGCAMTPDRGTSLAQARNEGKGNEDLHRQVLFDHQCPASKVRYIRADDDVNATVVDLDVCGKVRRYKGALVPSINPNFGASPVPGSWVDVRNQYPPESLPKPLAAASP